MIEAPPHPYSDETFRHLSADFPALSKWNALTVWRGSVAHGTYVPNDDPLSIDDKDLIGICIPSAELYTGLRDFGSRGTQEIMVDPWDVVLYEHRKALRLLAKGNPNMLCMLWAPPEFTVHYTAAGKDRPGVWRPRFSLSLRCDDRPVIEAARKATGGLGRIHEYKPTGTGRRVVRWMFQSQEDCEALRAIIDAHPLRSKKARDFAIWAKAVKAAAGLQRGRGTDGANGEIYDRIKRYKDEIVEVRKYAD